MNYTLITTPVQLEDFYNEHNNIEWIAFDTEFISEKRYYPQLCLIQVASPLGYFLIDTIVLEDISLFINLIKNEKILKITHAGANDYRLFYLLYQALPKSVYDVQIAVGFVGHRYPSALDSILKSELDIPIDKTQKVSDWAERPMSEEQIKYALVDVLYLKRLQEKIDTLLEATHRTAYAKKEMQQQLELVENYQDDPARLISKSQSLLNLNKQSQLFYLRLHAWREESAQSKNITRNMVLDNKMMIFLAKNIHAGLNSLQANRRAPKYLVFNKAKMLKEFYHNPPSEIEQDWLKRLPKRPKSKQTLDLLFDQIDLYIRYIGSKSDIDPSLILSRTELNKMKLDPQYLPQALQSGWQKELLGETIVEWLKARQGIHMYFENGQLVIENRES